MNQETTSSASAPQGGLGWRFRAMQEVPVGLAWLLGTSATFLSIGIVGMFAADLPPIILKSAADMKADSELPVIETTMAELQALNAEEPAEAEDSPPETLPEVPEVVETPPVDLDLPEVAEAMTQEDIFAIPTAPKIENALKPIDPQVKPKPRPTPTPRPATASRQSTNPGPSPGSSGVTASTGGRDYRPNPPYPSIFRSRGIQGSIRLQLTVGPSGSLVSSSVIGSSGHSEFDNSTSDWVRRNWRLPSRAGTRVPITFTFKLK